MEKVLFEMEKYMSGDEIAEYLREIADKIEQEETIGIESGDQKVSVDTDKRKEFEVKIEEENGEVSLELEIEFGEDERTESDNELKIG